MDPWLNEDVFGVILYFLAEEWFPLSPTYPGPTGHISVRIQSCLLTRAHGGYVMRNETVDWNQLAPTWFSPMRKYWAADEQGPPFVSILALYAAQKRVLASIATASAVCRQWANWIRPQWPRFYAQFEKFIPFVFHNAKMQPQRALVSRPPNRLGELPPAWYRLALKYLCKNGRVLANQMIKTKAVGRQQQQRRRPLHLKPKATYLVTHRPSGTRQLKPGSRVDLAHDTVELQLVEKSVGGHHYWATASLQDFDAAMARRERVLRDTAELMRDLKRQASSSNNHNV